MSAIDIRPYEPGDEETLCPLYGRVFGRPISAAHWRWKLKTVDSPAENVFVAEHDGRIVGQFAGIPARLRFFGEECWMMQSVDVMVDPDFQRRGIVTRFGPEAFGSWKASGFKLILGVPNQSWGTRKKALDILPWFELKRRSMVLRPEAVLARRLGLGRLGDADALGRTWRAWWRRRIRRDPAIRMTRLERADERLDRVWERCAGDAELSIVRDARRTQWRFLSAPDERFDLFLAERGGEPVGYAATRLEQRADGLVRGLVADLLAPRDDPAARLALLRDVLDHLVDAGAHIAQVSALEGAPELALYRRAGFLHTRPPVDVHLHPLDDDLPVAKLREPARWMIAAGDFDHV